MAEFIKQLKPLLMKAFKYVPIITDNNYPPKEMELKDVKYYAQTYNIRGQSPYKIKFTFDNGVVKYTNGGDPEWFDLLRIARELVGYSSLELPNKQINTLYYQKEFIIDEKSGSCDITGISINWWDRRHDGFFPLGTSSDKNAYWVCAPALRFFQNLQVSLKKETLEIQRAKLLPSGCQPLKL